MAAALVHLAVPPPLGGAVAAVLVVVLLLANAYFVAVEVGLLAARRHELEAVAAAGDPRGQRALAALDEVSVTIAAAQLGITLSALALGAVTEYALVRPLAAALGGTTLPPGVVAGAALVLGLSLVAVLHLVVGEMAPKNLALARAEAVALGLARSFAVQVALLRPVVRGLDAATRGLLRVVRIGPADGNQLVHSPAELILAVTESADRGTISPADGRVLRGALELSQLDAGAAMTPRIDLLALPDSATVREVLELADASGRSRFPVFTGDIDHVVGLIHVKDLLIAADVDADDVVGDRVRPLPTVPETRDLERLLREMLDQRAHAVLVVDEFGGTAGLLTLEDVLEELVGEIADEYDEVAVVPGARGLMWRVPGTLRLDEVRRLAGLELVGVDAETVSGWLVEQLGRLLEVGDRVDTEDGWRLTVRTLEGRRAGEVQLRSPAAGAHRP